MLFDWHCQMNSGQIYLVWQLHCFGRGTPRVHSEYSKGRAAIEEMIEIYQDPTKDKSQGLGKLKIGSLYADQQR